MGGIVYSECDVVVERIVEENSLLIHVTHKRTELCGRHLAYVHTIDGYGAFVYVVEARQKVGKGRFSRARLSHECHCGSSRHIERHIIDNPIAAIAEAHIAVAYALLHLGQRHRLCRLLDGVVGFENLVDAFHRSQAALYGV